MGANAHFGNYNPYAFEKDGSKSKIKVSTSKTDNVNNKKESSKKSDNKEATT